jgi:beta-lactamase class A
VFIIFIINSKDTHAATVAKTDAADIVLTQGQKNSLALSSTWKNILGNFKGSIDIALYNDKTGDIARYTNVDQTFDTASIVKLSILEETLLQDQAAGYSGLTDTQTDEATPMIENSDNDAATYLWDSVGGASAMNSFFKQVGATQTTAGDPAWGLTQTTAIDQLKVLNALAYPGKILTSDSASTADNLLDQVEPDQTWGVSGGVPSDVSFELKDGWLPDNETNDAYSNTDDWTVNSIGHVYGDGVDYTLAVLTDGDATEQDGINTIQSLSTAAWDNLSSVK